MIRVSKLSTIDLMIEAFRNNNTVLTERQLQELGSDFPERDLQQLNKTIAEISEGILSIPRFFS